MSAKTRAPSAYFAFCDERRAAVQQDLVVKSEGAKVSAAEVAKVLGEAWRGLDDADKQKYKEVAVQKAEEKAKLQAEAGDANGLQDGDAATKQTHKKARRGPTAYFAFMQAHRAEVQKELSTAAGEGQSVSVATVAKALGERWRSLTDEEKQTYTAIAEAKTKELQESADAEDVGDEDQQKHDAVKTGPALPLSLVKRIMSADDEFGRITGDGLKHVAFATELFLRLMARKAASRAATGKRSTIKFEDVLDSSRAEKRMRPFTDLLGNDPAFAELREGASTNRPSGPKAKLAVDSEAGTERGRVSEDSSARRITDFFKA